MLSIRSSLSILLLIALTSIGAHGQSNRRSAPSASKPQPRHGRTVGHTLRLVVRERGTHEPLPIVYVQLQPLGISGTTDMQGVLVLRGVPSGSYTIELSSLGYAKLKRSVTVSGDMSQTIDLQPETLALGEVTVTAKQNPNSASTSSVIERTAIDHLQAMSLADVMQLVPGQLMATSNLTSQSNMQVRTLVNNNTNAFGTNIVVDGVPISANGVLSSSGFSATAFVGTDLRQVSADDLESVEVVRGIPSAEYGDLTSGLVITKSRVGVAPWQVRAKLNPSTRNISTAKGWRIARVGIVNMNLDWAQAWGDPRMKTRSFDRYNASLGYGVDLSHQWNTNTKLRYSLGRDWSGNDPDAIQDGAQSLALNQNISLNHNGRITLGRPLSRLLTYTIGASLGIQSSTQTRIVPVPLGQLPIITSRETGYHIVPIVRQSYSATGGTESRPLNLYAKVNNQVNLRTAKLQHRINLGVDYGMDYNNARGYYNQEEALPLRPNSDGRPRPYSDIPPVHRFGAFVEDNIRLPIGDKRALRLMAGLRLTALQPLSALSAYSLSPRFNLSVDALRSLTLRAGIGWNSKTPSLDYLYPAPKYTDRLSASYYDPTNPEGRLMMYHTFVQTPLRNQNLVNATSRKIELGAEIKLSSGRTLSIVAFHDHTPNGFSSLSRFITYRANYYSPERGLVIRQGLPTQIDWANPERTDILFTTTGEMSNDNRSTNRGIELDADLGEITPLRTSVYLTAAYTETETGSGARPISNPQSLPAEYQQTSTVPFKVVYPRGLAIDRYRRFVGTLRLVTRLPELRMVASFTTQVVGYDWRHSASPAMDPVAWIDTDLVEHPITDAMLSDPDYKILGVSLAQQRIRPRDNQPVTQPLSWLLLGRLTKELGGSASFSIYANNMLYYEPFLASSASSTLSQRNTGTFSFGAELSVKL